jgi:thiol-disulfide isomerase/thioredoxin
MIDIPRLSRRRLLAAAVSLPASSHSAAPATPLPDWTGPSRLPDFSLPNLDGRLMTLGDFNSSVLLVNFWATWCAPCIEEMPSLQALARKIPGGQLTVVAINFKEGAAKIGDFLRRTPLAITLLRDTDGLTAGRWGVLGLPASYVLDRQRRVRHQVGEAIDWDRPDVVDQIKGLARS